MDVETEQNKMEEQTEQDLVNVMERTTTIKSTEFNQPRKRNRFL